MEGSIEGTLKSLGKTAQFEASFAQCCWRPGNVVRKEGPGSGASRPESMF